METSAIYVLLAALFTFVLPIGYFKEEFKIEVDTSLDWSGMGEMCKKPFHLLSDSIKDRMVTPTRNAFNGAIPFKPFFRKQRRMRKIAKIEKMAKKERMRVTEALNVQKEKKALSKLKKS